jgi:hypothetical protein
MKALRSFARLFYIFGLIAAAVKFVWTFVYWIFGWFVSVIHDAVKGGSWVEGTDFFFLMGLLAFLLTIFAFIAGMVATKSNYQKYNLRWGAFTALIMATLLAAYELFKIWTFLQTKIQTEESASWAIFMTIVYVIPYPLMFLGWMMTALSKKKLLRLQALNQPPA